MHTHTWFPLTEAVDRAFECLYWQGAGDEKVEAFASHWSGLDGEHFQQALESGEGEDQVLAIFALGLAATAATADLVAPLLFHTSRRQRWASAICLGLMKDSRAFPILEALLLDGLDLEEYTHAYQEENEDLLFELHWCQVFRGQVVQLLERRDTPSLVPTLKQAFGALWQVQQRFHRSRFEVANYDTLAYALGHRGDFTILHDVDLPREHRNTTMVYVALGHLQAKAPGASGLTGLRNHISELSSEMIGNDVLRQAVAAELAFHFGLSPAEQDDCLDNFHTYAELREEYGHTGSGVSDLSDEEIVEDEEEIADNKDEIVPVETSPQSIYRDHTARIQSLSWSPESTHLVSGSEDATARVWEHTTGKTVTVFRGHTASVNLVSWSPRGHLIASGSNDRKVCVWDAWTGEQLSVYRGHHAWIWGGLAWSPDGTKIASASLDGIIHIWDALSGEQLLTYHGHTGIIASLSWSPDGTKIASGGGYPECAIQIWEVQTGTIQMTYRDHQRDEYKQRPLFGFIVKHYDKDLDDWLRGASSVHGLAWSPDGTRIASAGLRTVCRVWNAQSGQNSVVSNVTEGPLIWSSDGVFLISPGSGNRVNIWNATTKRVVASYHIQGMSHLKALAGAPNGRFLAVSGKETGVRGKEIVLVWKVIL